MTITLEQWQTVNTGSESDRIHALCQLLGYPHQERDPGGSRFWYLRPGEEAEAAEDTRPIAIGFYDELESTDRQKSLTETTQTEIQSHFLNRVLAAQPVMYLLLPSPAERGDALILPKGARGEGQVALVLPAEGKQLRQRHIQFFAWDDKELLARLIRLQQPNLPIAEKALLSIPLVDWVFFRAAKTASELAGDLAAVTRRMEQAIPLVYEQESSDGYLHRLLDSFKRELLPNLKLQADNDKDYSFADIYAQTIAYGLFTARVFSHATDQSQGRARQTDFNRQDAWRLLPETNPFLRQLFRDVSERPAEELGEELLDAVSEIVGLLRAAQMDAILSDFRARMNREDIVIRFYEDFLAAYKPKMRERRGVYYTPEPVVSYMVRSVDILLQEKFNKPLGLADSDVMILDPACGTGTFLLWIFQLIHQRFQENPDALTEGLEDRSWSGYVKERLLPRIFGFELLMAPYAIAHLKLGLFLEETGYQFGTGRRLGVYLTNTLDDSMRKSETLFEEFIAEESDQASAIKRDKPVMVVIGNPPYSISSVNQGQWILSLLQDYKKDLGEKKINLDDDYIKFIRFAQNRIDVTGHGIFSFITNHSYLSGVVHRQMRKSLAKTFNDICIFDLHGNSVLKERAPDGSKDENVFDIQQGVSISG